MSSGSSSGSSSPNTTSQGNQTQVQTVTPDTHTSAS
jgi:hypothetical protein